MVALMAAALQSISESPIFRFEGREGKIARIRGYRFCPETLPAVAEDLDMLEWTGMYRAPTPAPGESWPTAVHPRQTMRS